MHVAQGGNIAFGLQVVGVHKVTVPKFEAIAAISSATTGPYLDILTNLRTSGKSFDHSDAEDIVRAKQIAPTWKVSELNVPMSYNLAQKHGSTRLHRAACARVRHATARVSTRA